MTDPAGNDNPASANRTFTLTYYTKADAKKPQVRGKLTLRAGSDLGLDLTPWSANRYALASGNSKNCAEIGGHSVVPDVRGQGGVGRS